MDHPLLELTGITKSFQAVRALRGVSFTLRAGEVHALLGENGAGKSTLIKVVSGAHAPDDGTVQVDGAPVERFSPAQAHRLGIACIYQQPALFPDLTVAENIGLALEPPSPWRLVRRSARRARARALLEQIGASIDPDAEVRHLSMPEQQLVEIAKAVGAGARILIMDEPTASLTGQEVDKLLAIVRELRAQGVGIIYVSHRLEEIFSVADRVTILRDGQSVATRPVAEVDHSELIRLMVGREMSAIYPPPLAPPGPVVLSVRALGSALSGVGDITFDLRAGEILGLSGLVGAGRTELARTLFGLPPADTGTIQLNGRPIQIRDPRDAIRQGIAYLPEDRRRHGVVLPLPIATNISLAAHDRLFPTGWLRPTLEKRHALQYIRDLQIKASSPAAPVATLSGGNQQKVALARWLTTTPKVLLLDEPTQGVDVGAKAEIHALIRRLAADGLAVLMISSDLPEILGMSDRIAVMREGTLIGILPSTASADEVMSAALGQALGQAHLKSQISNLKC